MCMKLFLFSFTRTAINELSKSQVLYTDFALSSLTLITMQIKVYIARQATFLRGKTSVSDTGRVFASQSLSEQASAV